MQRKRIGTLSGTAVFFLLFIIGVVLTGCVSTYNYGPADTPKEQMATLRIVSDYLRVVAIDEYSVKWKGGNMLLGGSTVNLPAGPYTLVVEYKEGSWLMWWFNISGASVKTATWHVSKELLPGHTYQVSSISNSSLIFKEIPNN